MQENGSLDLLTAHWDFEKSNTVFSYFELPSYFVRKHDTQRHATPPAISRVENKKEGNDRKSVCVEFFHVVSFVFVGFLQFLLKHFGQ